jgi:twinkle protein
VIPDANGNVVVFPFLERGVIVNEKYRSTGKRFWQRSGGKKTFWNADALDDPNLATGTCPLIITEGECFPDGTEVLTESGWVALENYRGGTVVSATEDGSLNFTMPLARICKPYNGDLIEYKTRFVTIRTTPGHNLVAIRKGRWVKQRADEMSPYGLMPRTGLLRSGPGTGLTADEIALCIAVSADAAIDVRKQSYAGGQARRLAVEKRYVRFGFTRQRKIARMRMLLDRLRITRSDTVIASGQQSICFSLPDWVPGRMLPWSWIADATCEERELIISELRHWDGNAVPDRNQDEFSTIHEELAKWVQAICHVSGRCSSIIPRSNSFGSWFKVSILHGKDHGDWQVARKRKTVGYNGDVHCLTVASGYLLVRQDSRIYIAGNCDALTSIDCGFPLTVSVPDGAPAVPIGRAPDQLDAIPEDDSGKFGFLWNNRDKIKKIRRFILAVDNDAPGQRLAAELVRRLSAARCWFVTYPEGCKDLNDVRVRCGPEAVTAVLNGAKPYPVRGLYRLSDYPEVREIPAVSTGWWAVDQLFKPFPGGFVVVSGIPGSGKSRWMLNLMCNLASMHYWPAAIFSPEMPTVPVLRDLLRRMLRDRKNPDRFIGEFFRFIDSDPTGTGEADETFDLPWIIDKAVDAVMRDGIRFLLIDPWNEIEHARRKDESGTDYIARSIRMLKRFARQYDVAVAVIAHPTKEVVDKSGKSRVPSLYDIEGSAAWFNKCDHGLVLDRPNGLTNEARIYVKKCRFDGTGARGEVRMKYEAATARFLPLDGPQEELVM